MAGLYFQSMFFRRVLAAFLALMFVGVSIVSFVLFGLTSTFLRQDFYTEDLKQPAYDFLVSSTILSIQENGGVLNDYFSETDLRHELYTVFPEPLFERMLNELVDQVVKAGVDMDGPLTLKLSTYRESLLTLAHNLSYRIFESLPECAADEIPDEGENGLPTCVPADVEYNDVSAPLTRQFEEAVYGSIPGQIEVNQNDVLKANGVNVETVLLRVETLKNIFYVSLLVLIALMALVIYRPFGGILMIEGVAFVASGVVGLLVGTLLRMIPFANNPIDFQGDYRYMAESAQVFAGHVAGLFGGEVQKGALMFAAIGASLLLVRYYIRERS